MMDDDEDQGLAATDVCLKFMCQRWEDGKLIRPTLIRQSKSRFWICPNCLTSYGEHAKGLDTSDGRSQPMQPQPYDFEIWGWFEPVSYRYGESLVERCRKERDKPTGWSDKARPLFSFSCAGDETYRVDYDGFVGTKQGVYVTREGRVGVVLQQVGTKVVHVYNSVRAVLLAKTERAEDDKQNSVDPSSVLLAQPHGMRLPLRDAIARAIIGPRKAVPPTSKFSLDELRAVSWRKALESERRDALSAADAILRIFEDMFT